MRKRGERVHIVLLTLTVKFELVKVRWAAARRMDRHVGVRTENAAFCA